MRQDTKIVIGILVLALTLAGTIVRRAHQTPPDGPRRTFPRDPCQVLTIDDVNAVVGVPEDSSYRTFAVWASDSGVDIDPQNSLGFTYRTDAVTCQWSQSTDSELAEADPPPPGVAARWMAEWQYAHVAPADWRTLKREVLAKRWCRSAARTPGAQDALWCGSSGLILFQDDIAVVFWVSDLFASEDDITAEEAASEPRTRRMAQLIMRRVASGCFLPPPPTVGPEQGRNFILRADTPEEERVLKGSSRICPPTPRPRPGRAPSP